MKRLTDAEVLELESLYVPNGEQFLLWAFLEERSGNVHVSRGRTSTEAWEYVQQFSFETLVPLPHCNIKYGKLYSDGHKPGWLERPPVWLLRKMFNR